MRDVLDWRERPWTIRVIVAIGLASIASTLSAGFTALNVISSAISLVLVFGLWRGSPGVRLYYVFGLLVLTVVNGIGLITDPAEHWDGFVASVAIFGLLLAPPTHEWARRREQQRDLKRARQTTHA